MVDVARVKVWWVDGEWRWVAQGRNWRKVAASTRGFPTAARAAADARRRYPGIEIVS